jgi:broad specificity phosphatase PhoE
MNRPLADEATRAATTELWLIRHAESTGNRDGVLQGQEDHPLSPFGHEQAKRLAKRLGMMPFSALYSSDLSRTQQTARYLAEAWGKEILLDAKLREIDVGGWSGLSNEVIAEQFPQEWKRWLDRDPTVRRGGGESYVDAQMRVTAAIQAIAKRHVSERIAIVMHGGVIRAYLASLFALDLRLVWHFSIMNTSICRIRPFAQAMGGTRPRLGRIECINDHAHLEGLKIGGITPGVV